MADLQDTLLQEFQQIQGAIADSTEAWTVEHGSGSSRQADTAPRGNVDSLGDQTGTVAIGGSSSSKSSSSSSGGFLDDLKGVLTGGLGIVPLGLELASIFGGGSADTPPPLTRYAMPESIGFIGSTDGAGALNDADFGQMGMPRSYGTPAPQYSSTSQYSASSQYSTSYTPASPMQGAPSNGGSGSQSQPIQITVQAMDAQSFLDRSDDIASAVNKAIRSLHPLTDTISNL
jgi:hypothetical protein